MNTRKVHGVVAAVAILLGSCSSDQRDEPTISGWVRPTPSTATEAVVYIVRPEKSNDAITSATIPRSIGSHTHLLTGPGSSGGDGHLGHLDGVPTKSAVPLGPGEPIMISGLRAPLSVGQKFMIDIVFESGTHHEVPVTVSYNFK